MSKKLIIHAGMHKTGSSSIQASFAALKREWLSYAPYTAANHSGLFEYLTSDNLAQWRIAKRRGTSRKELETKQVEASDAFIHFLQTLNGIGILSGERMSGLKSRERLERLIAIIAPHVDDIEVMIYVRPPVSYMQSAFQQRLKAEGTELNMRRLYPSYEKRFAPFFDVFGAERITMRAFHPWEFPDKDVVQDFAHFVGTTLGPDEIINKNESLSAEASALLYVTHIRNFDLETGENVIGKQRRFTEFLNQALGTQKFHFAPALTESVLHSNRDDIAWVEARLGRKLEDRVSSNGYEITTDQDLITLALDQIAAIEQILEDSEANLNKVKRKRLERLLAGLRSLS